jgi:hypothetical protein
MNDSDRRRLAEWVVSRIGGEYDLGHAWVLARSFLPAPATASLPPMPAGVAESATRFICSTLIANAFALAGYPVPAIAKEIAPVSTTDYRYVIPSDFERASGFETVL